MIWKTTLSLLFILQVCLAQAQENNSTTVKSKIKIQQDVRLEKLERHKNKLIKLGRPIRRLNDGLLDQSHIVSGYRVQIYTGRDRQIASQRRLDFMASHPNTPCYMHYSNSSFKVRVGDFIDKSQADSEAQNLRGKYAESQVVSTKVYRR